MYFNQIDDLFDGILNKFNNFLIKEKIFEKLSSDTNFVKYQNDTISCETEKINNKIDKIFTIKNEKILLKDNTVIKNSEGKNDKIYKDSGN